MTVSTEVAANLEESRQLTSIVTSVDTNVKALKALVTTLQGQIGATGLSEEDKAALLQSTTFIHDALATLTTDIAAA